MMVDRDFNVTYVNGPTMELLKKNATAFRGLWPNFDPDKIVGTCIDTFHKNPAHQRKLLSDQSKLPLKTEITIGDLKVQLLVSASLDRRGNYVGNVLEWQDVTAIRMNAGMLSAIDKSQAVIEFTPDGKIVHANENFLKTLGYTLDEVRGQHHSMFVEAAYRENPEYRAFWQKLGRGEFDAGQYKRIGKAGKEVWIQASYNPILDANGKVFKVVKYATDITQQKLQNADYEGQIAAISKAQAVIEFSLDGKILNANDNFLKTLGYTLGEVRGQHHSMFVEAAYRESPEYRAFWQKLGRGEFDAGQYKRIGKAGKEVWIQASYNPIMDMSGKPFKVVKYATDVTAQVLASQALQLAVQQTQEVVSAAKENDLTQRIPLDGKSDEIKALCAGVNGLIDTMAHVISEIKSATREVTNASAEISTSTTDLSQRTEEQAASLEETSASMEEISATVKKNAENAQQANQFAGDTRQVAERGGAVVNDAIGAMAQIEELFAQDIRHHWRDRRDRPADQLARAQRRGRSGARRRRRTWLCGGGHGSAQPRATLLAGCERHQGSHHQQFEPSQKRRRSGQPRRDIARRDRRLDQEGRRHCVRYRGRQRRTGGRDRAGQQGADADGRGHAAELGVGRGECGDRQDAREPGAGHGRAGGRLPHR